MIENIFAISKNIRYVAIYRDEKLETRSKSGTEGASNSETDRYEELLVNPILLKVASQRGNIDCGGLDYLLIPIDKIRKFFSVCFTRTVGSYFCMYRKER